MAKFDCFVFLLIVLFFLIVFVIMVMGMELIFIAGNVPSSKNGKVWTGRFLVSSKASSSYFRDSIGDYRRNRDKFRGMVSGIDDGIVLMLHFIRGSHHKWDFDNACNTILDAIKQNKDGTKDYAWVSDDNSAVLIPAPLAINGKLWDYDKKNPGVWIGAMSFSEYSKRCGIIKK